jgi:hypothetical protein
LIYVAGRYYFEDIVSWDGDITSCEIIFSGGEI